MVEPVVVLGGWNELSARLKGQPKVVFAVSASINSKVFVGGAPCEERGYTYIVDGTMERMCGGMGRRCRRRG